MPARVLIVDDNALNHELARFVLEAAGYVVSSAFDTLEARRELALCAPDLILMDIQLPGEDGLALTRELKADAATRQIAIAAFTAYAMRGDEARMREAGCDGYIAKPIDVERLPQQVQACIDAGDHAD